MPIIRANTRPPFNIIRLSHIELGVTDLARSAEFYTEMLGLVETERTEGAVYLRGIEERNHHSFVLTKTPEPVVKRLGYKLASEDDLDQAQVYFEGAGLEHAWVARHAQGRTLHARDPFGVPLELYFRMDSVERKLQAYGEYRGAQVMRIDHFNLFVPSVQAVHDFYTGELGFRVTEYTETDEDDPKLWAIWLHRKGNVHDLALTNGRGPRLHHVGVWVPTAMNIIHACDMLATTGRVQALERGPGRHGLSNAFFLYLRDPDGHRIELYTSDYLTVDPDFEPIRWSLDDPQRQTLWGHAAPKSWFEEGTPLEGVEVREPELAARPVVAR
jgi:catechol 2,3-dioxygenase